MTESNTTAVRPDLQPPKESRTSTVLNGIGNGLMVGGIPLAAIETYKFLKANNKPLPALVRGAAVASAVLGGVAGLVLGQNETHLQEQYRQKITDEVNHLRHEVDELKKEKRNWQERTLESAQQNGADIKL